MLRTIVASVCISCFALVPARGDDKPAKLDEKALVGKWQIKYVSGKNNDTVEKTIELKADGTYIWTIAGSKMEGTYKLTGTTLALTRKGQTGAILWKDLSLKDGKIIQPVGQAHNELTRIDEKK